MLPCIRWLQTVLALVWSSLLTCGQCPLRCVCPDHHTVDCRGQALTRVPDSLPLDVRRLLLSNNWISELPSDFLLLYTDLLYLDLRNNSLSALEPGTFSSTSRLVFLDLGSNNLTEIPSGTFGESSSLVKLRLGDNPYLGRMEQDSLVGLSSLRELELQRTALSELDVQVLQPLSSLKRLRLEGNPWLCNCYFSRLYEWLRQNQYKLHTGLEGMECSLGVGGRRVALSMLSQESFRECQGALTVTDYLIVIFSGISVSVVAIVASFFLASTAHCCHRLGKFNSGDEEDGPS